mmetsp:Transcript_27220/g.87396  ORF Transcript_27220/g.87396 Transcript_27220/m.87396 type:complete len:212 (-) Transcript_27220:1595-2230(-)
MTLRRGVRMTLRLTTHATRPNLPPGRRGGCLSLRRWRAASGICACSTWCNRTRRLWNHGLALTSTCIRSRRSSDVPCLRSPRSLPRRSCRQRWQAPSLRQQSPRSRPRRGRRQCRQGRRRRNRTTRPRAARATTSLPTAPPTSSRPAAAGGTSASRRAPRAATRRRTTTTPRWSSSLLTSSESRLRGLRRRSRRRASRSLDGCVLPSTCRC